MYLNSRPDLALTIAENEVPFGISEVPRVLNFNGLDVLASIYDIKFGKNASLTGQARIEIYQGDKRIAKYQTRDLFRWLSSVKYLILNSNGNRIPDETFDEACRNQSDLGIEPVSYKHRLTSLMISDSANSLPEGIHVCELLKATFTPAEKQLEAHYRKLKQQHPDLTERVEKARMAENLLKSPEPAFSF